MIVLLTILVAVIVYFTWRISIAVWRLNNMLGVVLDALFKISSRTDMGMEEIRNTLGNVTHTFIKEFGPEAYKQATEQV